MQVLAPSQISGEIMRLMDEAAERMIIVSPYFNISQWHKLLRRLDRLQSRNITVEFYVRENAYESIEQIRQAGFSPRLIEGLHTKIYMNERCGIVSSMNLSEFSDCHSLDIAVKSDNEHEYAQLHQYYSRYIASENSCVSVIRQITDWPKMLDRRIEVATGTPATIALTQSALIINGQNKYEAFISNDRGNDLRISGILTGREYEAASKEPRLFSKTAMEIELIPGRQGRYHMVWGTQTGLKSRNIHAVRIEEEPVIAERIISFICAVELFKRRMVG